MNDVSLEFADKGMYVILGKSGCGKTTLVNLLCGLDDYNSGELLIDGKDISLFSKQEMDEYHNLKVGLIFQHFNLISELNVYDNLRLALDIQELSAQDIEKKIREVLNYVDMSGYEKRKIGQLSGGEQQRIAVARALIKQPEIVIADEPTGNLDGQTGEKIFQLLKKISKDYMTIIVTHDRESAYKYADYILFMKDGCIEEMKKNYGSRKEGQYSLEIAKKGTLTVQHCTGNLEMLAQLITTLICECQESDELKIVKVKEELQQPYSPEALESKEKKCQRTSKDISRARKWKLASTFMRKRKYQCFFTSSICAIAILFMYFFTYITFYDAGGVMENYLNQYQPEILPLYKTASYEDPFFNQKTKDYSSGKEIKELLYSNFTQNAKVLKYIAEAELSRAEADWKSVDNVTLFMDEGNAAYTVEHGRKAECPDDIVITDYLADELQVEVGDVVIADNISFTVCGIIETDYRTYKYKQRLSLGEENEYLYYYMSFKYNVSYVNYDYFIREKTSGNSGLRLENSDFSRYNKELSYFENSLKYNGVSDKENDITLVSGKFPSNKNEIIISEELAERIMLSAGEEMMQQSEYEFKDIHDERYNGYWLDCINLYEYFPEGIIVAGVFRESISETDVCLFDEVWERIKRDYYNDYYFSWALSVTGNAYGELIEKAYQYDVRFNEPGIVRISQVYDIINEFSWILYVILVAVFLLNLLISFVFASISVKGNVRNIAILRSLGVSERHTRNIFEIENRVIFWCSLVMSVIFSAALMYYVNFEYQSTLKENPFSIVRWNWVIFGCVFALEYLLNYLGAYIPIKKLSEMKPIHILHS